MHVIDNRNNPVTIQTFLETVNITKFEDYYLDTKTQLVLCKFIDDHVKTLTTE